jgi:hypothetical protein
MTDQRPTTRPLATSMKICFERIVPAHVHPMRIADRAARDTILRMAETHAGRTLSAEDRGAVLRMAVICSKKWPTGAELRCRFLGGSATQRRRVEEVAHLWEQDANIRLSFVASGESQIRISFGPDPGSWSAVGNDALIEQYFPRHQPTMNLGWLEDETAAEEYHRVVLHEFGHALGCIHEHSSPRFERQWNRERVIEVFSGPPNYWSDEETERNVLRKYSPQGLVSSRYDPLSIMLYYFDASLFDDDSGPTNRNSHLSLLDIETIQGLYPET